MQFRYLHDPAYWPPSPCLLANHITLPGREIPGAGRVITLPKGDHPALGNSLQIGSNSISFCITI